jgi:hypothetical protein
MAGGVDAIGIWRETARVKFVYGRAGAFVGGGSGGVSANTNKPEIRV